MIAWAILTLGLVLGFEGLVFALAPARLEQALDLLRDMPVEARRLVGLLCLTAGIGLVALARAIGL